MPQLIGREQFDVDAAVAGLLDPVDRVLRALVDRMARILSGGELVIEFCRVRILADHRRHRQCGGQRAVFQYLAAGLPALGQYIAVFHACLLGFMNNFFNSLQHPDPFNKKITATT
jgi:hypothetical protein